MSIPQVNINNQKKELESNFMNFNLDFNNKKYIFSLYDIGNDSFKIIAKESLDSNEDVISLNKYFIILKFEELKILHKYFKMFDNFEQVKINIMDLHKANFIKIVEAKENELSLNFDLKIVGNESMIINLTKMENNINDINENISYIFKCYTQQKQEIKELKNTIKEMNNIISNLIERIENLDNKSIKSTKSKIIKNEQELMLLYNAISPQKNNLSLELLYNSEKDGENAEKFKNSYLNKNDILILIQTKKDKRFGGYVHEKFKNIEGYEMKDSKAFLFNLNKMKIYKAKEGKIVIWNNDGNSMDFGYGTDLRIFHNFLSKQNYTFPTKSDFDYDENYSLNDEKYFDIKYLELYQVNIN